MIAIVDYQMGNLRSVQKACQKIGAAAEISEDPAILLAAERLILPGVGAFPDAMRELGKRGLDQVVRDFVASGKPLLGICLGMQLLLDSSLEHGQHAGLGIVAGMVQPFQLPGELKIPHIGWNLCQVPPGSDPGPDQPVFGPLADQPQHFYFVHSFICVPSGAQVVALEADYGGVFAAALAWRNVVATQFHPEKSQSAGLALLQRFANWQPGNGS